VVEEGAVRACDREKVHGFKGKWGNKALGEGDMCAAKKGGM